LVDAERWTELIQRRRSFCTWSMRHVICSSGR